MEEPPPPQPGTSAGYGGPVPQSARSAGTRSRGSSNLSVAWKNAMKTTSLTDTSTRKIKAAALGKLTSILLK